MPEEDEDYAIVSKKEFLKLKKELEQFKKQPFAGTKEGESLQESISNLNLSLNSMMEMFKTAAEEMKLDEHDTGVMTKQMEPITEKLDTLVEQNQKIAKGIVAIADLVKEKFDEIGRRLDETKKPEPRNEMPRNELPPLRGGPMPQEMQGPPPGLFGPPPNFGPPNAPPMRGAPMGAEEIGEMPMDEGMDFPPLEGGQMQQGWPPGPSEMSPMSGAPPPGTGNKRSIFGGLMKK